MSIGYSPTNPTWSELYATITVTITVKRLFRHLNWTIPNIHMVVYGAFEIKFQIMSTELN